MLGCESEKKRSFGEVLDLVRYVVLVLRELVRELCCDLTRFVDIVDDIDLPENDHTSDRERHSLSFSRVPRSVTQNETLSHRLSASRR